LSKGGDDWALAGTWGGVAIAASLVTALAFPAVLRALEDRKWSRAAMATMALTLCGSYSVSAALGSASGSRINAARTEQSDQGSRARAQSEYERAQEALKSLGDTIPLAEVEADIANARPRCRVHVSNGRRQTTCNPPPDLLADRARALERQRLERVMAQASAALIRAPAKIANSDAVALASMTPLSADTWTRVLTILSVLLVECGSGLSLATGMALSARQPASTVWTAPTKSAPPAARAPAVERLPAPSPASQRLLDHLRSHGGRVVASQIKLGKQLGVSRARISQLLVKLEAQGLIAVSTSTSAPKSAFLQFEATPHLRARIVGGIEIRLVEEIGAKCRVTAQQNAEHPC
jgi:hypothetical protein